MQLFEWKIAVETLPMLFALVRHQRAVKLRRELGQGQGHFKDGGCSACFVLPSNLPD
jgi:hypothetical protein